MSTQIINDDDHVLSHTLITYIFPFVLQFEIQEYSYVELYFNANSKCSLLVIE